MVTKTKAKIIEAYFERAKKENIPVAIDFVLKHSNETPRYIYEPMSTDALENLKLTSVKILRIEDDGIVIPINWTMKTSRFSKHIEEYHMEVYIPFDEICGIHYVYT